jgi:acyl-CoA synthetase (AMP-forming)/AMP-acid ligase II
LSAPAFGIAGLLRDAAAAAGGRTAVAGDVELDYRALEGRVRRCARELVGSGLARGERVALLEDNTPDFLVAYFAAAWAGAVLVPLNHRLAAPELERILEHAGVRLLLCGARHADLARGLASATGTAIRALAELGAGVDEAGAPAPARPEDLAQIYYTSGTTGRPKGVMLTQGNVCAHARMAAAELALSERDRWGHLAPMFHLADAWACFAVTLVRGTHLFVPRFEVEPVLELIAGQRMTMTNLVPTMLNRLVKSGLVAGTDCSSLRLILSGGAPISPALVRETQAAFGCEYAQTYGLTETCPYLTMSLLDPDERALPPAELLARRARTGRSLRGVELEVVDGSGARVAADDAAVGEIRVRGATVSPGYWRAPEETAAAHRDGWFYTGDLAAIDARGSIRIVDRKKDMILSGGENVYSTEVENALYEHPAVLEAAVYGVPDEEWGELVCAAVVLKPGRSATAAELVAACRARIAAYKAPRRVEFLAELPKTGTGKIEKRVLRARAAAGG